MYYEEKVVKQYGRSDGRPNKQINLGVNSTFKKGDKVIVMSSDKIETFKQNLEPKTKELENQLEVCRNENQKLKDELKRMETDKANIESENKEIIKVANDNVIDAKDKLLEKENEIKELQRHHADELKQKDLEIKKLNQLLQEENAKLVNEKDTSKTLLLALYSYEERGIINSFFNRTPQLAKQILKENPKPIDTTKKE